jgi:threonine dehydrogenase-like Zn-dependent dehydrogenase
LRLLKKYGPMYPRLTTKSSRHEEVDAKAVAFKAFKVAYDRESGYVGYKVSGENMKLTIIGTGYVGLVTGTCFAEVGHQVICVDNDAAKVKMLQAGGIPIYEPGLEELVKKNVAAGRLSFTNSTAEGVQKSDVIFIAVPTPPQPDGSVDLSFIERVARDIAAAMTRNTKSSWTKAPCPSRPARKFPKPSNAIARPRWNLMSSAIPNFCAKVLPSAI